MQDNEIKSLIPVICPHCQKNMMVEIITNAPNLSDVYTFEMIEEAKQEAIKQIKSLLLPEEVTNPVIDWVKSPETIFTSKDIGDIINNLQKQVNEQQEKENQTT